MFGANGLSVSLARDQCIDVMTLHFPWDDPKKLSELELGFVKLSGGKFRGCTFSSDGFYIRILCPRGVDSHPMASAYASCARAGLITFKIIITAKSFLCNCRAGLCRLDGEVRRCILQSRGIYARFLGNEDEQVLATTDVW